MNFPGPIHDFSSIIRTILTGLAFKSITNHYQFAGLFYLIMWLYNKKKGGISLKTFWRNLPRKPLMKKKIG